MRFGLAIDLHATPGTIEEVAWPRIREQVMAAEKLGFDLVVLPDHLAYRAGGAGDYALDDESVGVRETMTVAAAAAAITDRIGIGHSVVNAPYRTPAMVAHLATTIADIAGGRYSLGVGAGNSADYDQLGVSADRRAARLAEYLAILAPLLREGRVDVAGEFWSSADAELVLRDPALTPTLVVAAGGPVTMRIAAGAADAWNGFCPTDPASGEPERLLELLERSCDEIGRDPSSIGRTFDLGVDPLDRVGARERSVETLARLAELGVDEVRCYPVSDPRHASRMEAMTALAGLRVEP